ncbi:hypothetical protein LTR37_007652 [Vermiconidia calcicola]|uniref:Uncharacterized protein n=1 Tax=Vermiconidia calcicola TaxID=1690605 RepID=A0ACC3NDB0_9PEZI|nr:hypothetical protein LTR37_007652 [Vermiconidia calcicola]
MVPTVDDRWLWLGFGIIIICAVKGIRYAVSDIVDLTAIDPYPDEPKPKKHEEQPEDSESTETNIANTAISVIIERFSKQDPNAYQNIVRDLRSKNERTREQAKMAINFLHDRPLPPALERQRRPYSPLGYASDSLVVTLPARRRTARHLTSDDLARPEGMATGPDPSFEDLAEEAEAQMDSTAEREIVPSEENPVAGWTNVPRERPVAGEDEAERRRNRREAMVLHEGEGGVLESDIIRPTH